VPLYTEQSCVDVVPLNKDGRADQVVECRRSCCRLWQRIDEREEEEGERKDKFVAVQVVKKSITAVMISIKM
jgi:hypothetical protein